MSHLFNSHSNIPKSSYQPTSIIHCRVARPTPSLDPQVYRHMQLKIGQKGEKGSRSIRKPTGICKTTLVVYRRPSRLAQKESRKVRRHHEHSITKKKEGTYRQERHIRKPFPPRPQPFLYIERSKLSLRHKLARFLWHRRGLLCTLKTGNWFEKIFSFL